MAKDPAFLFYSNDFLSGTFTFSDEQVGKYIRLLCIQHQKGFLLEKDMLKICKTYDEDIYSKFIIRDGLYVNLKLEVVSEKRKLYAESRRSNRLGAGSDKDKKSGKKGKTYDSHMEIVIIDINNITYAHKKFFKNENHTYSFAELFEIFWGIYPEKDGKKAAEKHFSNTVKKIEDVYKIDKAIYNYLNTSKVKNGYIKNGSTFFNNWQDFINITPETATERKYTTEEYRNAFGQLAEDVEVSNE